MSQFWTFSIAKQSVIMKELAIAYHKLGQTSAEMANTITSKLTTEYNLLGSDGHMQ